ncbi:MAG: type I DNA topoisomerase [Bdellovibrionales bacterium]|nr:type I DNA topoisomerase [Bdellovibrionales bacterium]
MSSKKLVVVESPTKARTIKKFLGNDFIVESCMGHVRDLPQSAKDIPEKYKKEKWSNLGVNVEKRFEPIYCIPKNKTKVVKELKTLLKESDELILATDEDREGESISWHLVEVLKPTVPVKRMVFHEITKPAIKKALQEFRSIDENLVKAQEARRVLDRLVGYTISPLLWKKVAYGLSAGRVQSVAVKLISEKEHERISFVKAQYWSLKGENEKEGKGFESRMVSYKGDKIASGKDFDPDTGELFSDKKQGVLHLKEEKAENIAKELKAKDWVVKSVEEKPVFRKPAPPFITSTLQQEANRKLGLSSRETMSVAQKLYERGFITYMRTDSTALSEEAIKAARQSIADMYGKKYLPDQPRDYSKKKAKGAQEAHEAIRPAGSEFKNPEETKLSGTQFRLYDLIWKRTMASQMVDAKQLQVRAQIEVGDALFNASGMTIEFPGFLKAYVEGKDDPEQALQDREVHLPKLKVGEKLKCKAVSPQEHETKPPARYTEASLVQKLESEGVGRPSTYASIISTIQDRGYVIKVGNALAPTFTALVVTKLLSQSLPDYVDLNFTSEMEKSLDTIAQGELDNIKYLDGIYNGKRGLKSQVEMNEEKIQVDESRQILLKGFEDLVFKVGRYGAYVCRIDKETGEEVCASLPDSLPPGDMSKSDAHELIDRKIKGVDALGKDPKTQLPVYVLTGRYGPYVQLGESDGEEAKPKRMAIPANLNPDDVTLDQALKLLSLPLTLGEHPTSGKEIKASIGRFGPYVVCDGDFRSIPKTLSIFDIDLKSAIELMNAPKKGRGRSAPIKELGEHPTLSASMEVFNGRYGPYIKCGKVNVSLPEGVEPESVTAEKAIELLAEKVAEASEKKSKSKAVKKKVKKKTVSKVSGKKSAKKAEPQDEDKKVVKKKIIRRKKV